MRNRNFKLIKALWMKGLKQHELARLADLPSEARLSRIINGLVHPTQSEVEKISSVLGQTPLACGLPESVRKGAQK